MDFGFSIARIKSTSIFLFALCTFFFAHPLSAHTEPAKKVPIIGILAGISVAPAYMKAFREGLHEHGYTEGRNIELVFRSGEGHFDKIPGLAAELVQLKVNVIVTGGPEATGPSKDATHSIPIVMAQDNDPVGNGFIASLARPGANITGLSALSAEMSGKRLELLKEIVPTLSRVAVSAIQTIREACERLRKRKMPLAHSPSSLNAGI